MCLSAPLLLLHPQVELRAEAHHQVEHFREKNKAALLNLLSDGAPLHSGVCIPTYRI